MTTTDVATPRTGRRERKKSQTREALADAARRLFAAQGYAATTVQQIASEADVSERTFFRYFDAKEDLLLPEITSLFTAIEAAIRTRPAKEPPLTSILESTLDVVRARVFSGSALLASGVDASDPAIASRLVNAFVDWEARLAEVLVERFSAAGPGRPAGSKKSVESKEWDADPHLRATVVAQAAAAAMRAALRTFRARRATEKLPPTALGDMMRFAFGVLEAGCPAP